MRKKRTHMARPVFEPYLIKGTVGFIVYIKLINTPDAGEYFYVGTYPNKFRSVQAAKKHMPTIQKRVLRGLGT